VSAQLTTTGATRLYRHRAGATDSEQRTSFRVDDGATLEYLPDPVIPFARSRHTQRTKVELGLGSTLFWWEVIAPGRLASGERFAFERLQISADVRVAGKQVMREDYVLEPQWSDLAAMSRMFEYSHTISLVAIQQGRPVAFWRALEDQLNEMAQARTMRGQIVWGASTLASDGLVIRGLSTSGRFIFEPLIEFWRTARVAITGSDCAPPRKIY
jgi:urease accessory protein